jgi:hypothetical protein
VRRGTHYRLGAFVCAHKKHISLKFPNHNARCAVVRGRNSLNETLAAEEVVDVELSYLRVDPFAVASIANSNVISNLHCLLQFCTSMHRLTGLL